MLDAVPDNRHVEPGNSIWPLIAALATGVMFITSVYTPWGLVIGTVVLTPAMFGWLWPRKMKRPEHEVVELPV
jgi:cytochrome c oxidase subunit 1